MLIQKAGPWIVLLAASIATNTNLLIAVALTGSASRLKFAWRTRLLFDLATTVAIYFHVQWSPRSISGGT